MSFFNGREIDAISLKGLEHVISISCAPTPASLNFTETTTLPNSKTENTSNLPKVHIRAYTTKLLNSGTRIPRVELVPMGPNLDLSLRRHTEADPELLKEAMKRPKVKKSDIESGLGKKRKNIEVDEMGDMRGRIHVAKQDLSKLQTRKMKGLKDFDVDVEMDEPEDDDGDDDDNEGLDEPEQPSWKRRKT
jgi:ribosome production factor 2